MPSELWPTDPYSTTELLLRFNGELIQVLHEPRAHTDGDAFVHFTSSNVISAGDIYHRTRYPFIDSANGGSMTGVISALSDLMELATDGDEERRATIIVPGHGDIAGEMEVREYRDMLVTIRDRIQAMIDEGMSLEQVLAARPTSDYDASFGREAGFWTTQDFVVAIYQELAGE
jgi:glyoxylase-like metal-dependent hydrolase (beta-lactamase superfamily II)